MVSRSADIVSVEQFFEDQENENTKKKTQQNVALLKGISTLKNESRLMEEIPPKERLSLQSFDRESKLYTFVITQYSYNKQITSWLVRLYDFYSIVVLSLRSLVRLRFFTTREYASLFIYSFIYLFIYLFIQEQSGLLKSVADLILEGKEL